MQRSSFSLYMWWLLTVISLFVSKWTIKGEIRKIRRLTFNNSQSAFGIQVTNDTDAIHELSRVQMKVTKL